MNYCHGSSPTSIRMRYQSVTIQSTTYEMYVHPYYCFRPEANDYKIFIAGNDTNTTKHDLTKKFYNAI